MFNRNKKENIGAPISDFDKFTEEIKLQREKLCKLQLGRVRIENQINELSHEVAEIAGKVRSSKVNPITAAAQQMLNGETPVNNIYESIHKQMGDLGQQKKVVEEAIRLQEIVINDLLFKKSVSARQTLRPLYREKVHDMARAAIELSKAITAERVFRDDLDRKEISFSVAMGQGTTFTRIGELTDRNSKVVFYLSELLRDGWLTQQELENMVKG